MSKKWILILIVLMAFNFTLMGDFLHTVDRKVYEGKMVAFKYDTVYFNVYKFGKIYKTIRFPIYKVWKVEFNEPKKDGLESSFEVEQNYNKWRKGKRTKKFTLDAKEKWVDTGIKVKIGQEILFNASGSINIDPDTVVYQTGEMNLNWNKKKPLPNQPTGAIIGRVGTRGKPFYIGNDKAPFQMSEKGDLFLGINDFDFEENSGSFSITVYY